jgi:hypothetical protein
MREPPGAYGGIRTDCSDPREPDVIYIFGLAFAAALLLVYQIKRTPLDRKQSPASTKITTFKVTKVTGRTRVPEPASMSHVPVRVMPRALGFGKRTRD